MDPHPLPPPPLWGGGGAGGPLFSRFRRGRPTPPPPPPGGRGEGGGGEARSPRPPGGERIAQLPHRLPSVTERVFLLRRQFSRGGAQIVKPEVRVVAEAVGAARLRHDA